ncbi:MAG: hypothetical protein LBO20_09060 [Bifidobacteriaceae bacterium]|nr:hypothetical protein [Bifidobacteriaceae bacterium]
MADSATDAEDGWDNQDLSVFLEAWAAWLYDMEGYYLSIGEEPPQGPTWSFLADQIRAATMYE